MSKPKTPRYSVWPKGQVALLISGEPFEFILQRNGGWEALIKHVDLELSGDQLITSPLLQERFEDTKLPEALLFLRTSDKELADHLSNPNDTSTYQVLVQKIEYDPINNNLFINIDWVIGKTSEYKIRHLVQEDGLTQIY